MKTREAETGFISLIFSQLLIMTVLCLGIVGSSMAANLTVVGVNKDGTETALTEYRWLVEQDDMYHVDFDASGPISQADILATGFHKSYMQVVDKGTTPAQNLSDIVLDTNNYYHVSVIPVAAGSYSIGGAVIAPGQTEVTVYLNQLPLPTAQITIYVYEDTAPVNNAPDNAETGLGGFQILLEDAGGRYGASAGAQSTDAFGNPLGTQYQMTCDPFGQNPGTGSNGCLDADGAPIVTGVEPLLTGADGYLTIKNLAPGKYGIQAVPPSGSGYQQTSTIEGTKVIDAWVKANEPPYFAEFGPAGVHVAIGFIQPFVNSGVLSGGQTITGQVTNLHLTRPPDSAFYSGAPFEHTTAWVGLNTNGGLAGTSEAVFAARANADGTFAIPNVPPGNYQLAVWDDNLDIVFAFQGITVNESGCDTPSATCNLGDVPVFQWFTRMEHWVFNDQNENGMRDAGELGIPEQAVNLRWRDGTVYQSFPTDGEGYVPFDQTFPFFHWQVAEVDFARFKATGATIYVDDGGPVDYIAGAEQDVVRGQLNTQVQGNPVDPDSVLVTDDFRVETGPVLTQAFQGFLGQTSVIEWGKKAYGPMENGGISGIVFYSTTRAEDDPRYGAAEPWEPGVPRVTVNLYDSSGSTLLNTTTTDSWDDNLPQNCQYGVNAGSGTDDPFRFTADDGSFKDTDCYDGMRNWNQVRPGVFDGGYAFNEIVPGGVDSGNDPVAIPAGDYLVEVIPPAGYEIVRSQDRNVDFGENYVPAPNLLPSDCVGDLYTVPAVLTLFPGVDAPLAGQELYSCDRKRVLLSNGANAAADFFIFTEVPIAGHFVGMILDDTANEFDPNSPQFGEKYAPPWMPIGIYDWTGRLISHTYSDQFGRFNALVPSTYTTNLPAPSGMSPNMVTTCMNDSNPAADPEGRHNAQYSSFCYTFQYMPGTTTYLDTPVIPVAAFAGPEQFPLDCELPAGEPRIQSVTASNNGVGGGPYVPSASGPEGPRTLTITSLGTAVEVPNPAYGELGAPATITRDYGFGPDVPGRAVTIGAVPMNIISWTDTVITGTVAAGTTTGQLTVTRGDNGQTTTVGVTVQVGLSGNGANRQEIVAIGPGDSIQAAIDGAKSNDIIMIAPGIYDEMVIMWKPVRLQGWGAGATTIHAVKIPVEKLQNWRNKVEQLVTDGLVDLLDGQNAGFGGIEPATLFTEEGAGVLVLARANGNNSFDTNRNRHARIDGLTIASADTGGGIVVNAFADYLRITNNRVINNNGFFGGGIRLGQSGEFGQDAQNDHILISHNDISRNGGLNGAGGGVSLYSGSDSYEVSENFICGNFSLGHGGGIGHLGLSLAAGNNEPVPVIGNNRILFNQTFNQGLKVSGGGIHIGGEAVLNGLTEGSGSVIVNANLIQGNQAGAGDGGGISLSLINGQDVSNQGDPEYRIDILNNMIVNNQSGEAGGGISLLDAPNAYIVLNTIANNDSTATAAGAFSPGLPTESNPQPAGLVSRGHSPALAAVLGAEYGTFSNPQLVDNVIWHNRTFHFLGDQTVDPPQFGLIPDLTTNPGTEQYWDLGVVGAGAGAALNPQYNLLSALTDFDGSLYSGTNLTGDPTFVFGYNNGGRGTTVMPGETTTAFSVPLAFDEGGNFIQVRFGPLTLGDSNYHIGESSPAVDAGTVFTGFVAGSTADYDGQLRPAGAGVDIGADEVQ